MSSYNSLETKRIDILIIKEIHFHFTYTHMFDRKNIKPV